jgi:hypothetical protein
MLNQLWTYDGWMKGGWMMDERSNMKDILIMNEWLMNGEAIMD